MFSRYARWPPSGLGTGEVESLTSAVRRLAHAEVRAVGDVLHECVIEPYQRERCQRQPIIQPTRVVESVNGASETARIIVDRIAAAGVPGLERTTLLGRDQGIEFREAFRALRQWCPVCLEEDGDEAYDRLTWALRASRCCVRHGVVLVDRCARCGRGHRPWHARANPWSCPHCGELLANAVVRLAVEGDSATVHDLITLLENGSLIDRASVAAAFDVLRARAGGLHALATRLDHSLAGLSTVCRGLTRPHLALVLRALALADEPLALFLGHERVVSTATARRAHLRRSPSAPAAPLEHDLRRALRAGVPPSLRHLARVRRVDVATLRRRFPTLARQLVRKRRAHEARRRRTAEAALAQSVRTAFARLTRSGHVPSRRQVEAALSRPGVLRAPVARRAYAEILRELAI